MVGIPHRAQKESGGKFLFAGSIYSHVTQLHHNLTHHSTYDPPVVGCFHRSWMGKKKLVPGLLMQRLEIGVSHGTEA